MPLKRGALPSLKILMGEWHVMSTQPLSLNLGENIMDKKPYSINAAKEIMCVEEESSDYNPGRTRMIMGSGLHEDPVFDLWRDSNRGKSDH